MTDLAEWLLAQYGADEPTVLDAWATNDEARLNAIRADIAAKRAIVELHSGHHECVAWQRYSTDLARPADVDQTDTVLVEPGFIHEHCPTLRLLALPLADREGYDPNWA